MHRPYRPQGRPRIPREEKRVGIHTTVDPRTEEAIRVHAIRRQTSPGKLMDEVFQHLWLPETTPAQGGG